VEDVREKSQTAIDVTSQKVCRPVAHISGDRHSTSTVAPG
jgi:hypothetical protein